LNIGTVGRENANANVLRDGVGEIEDGGVGGVVEGEGEEEGNLENGVDGYVNTELGKDKIVPSIQRHSKDDVLQGQIHTNPYY
jgi:hypothetical protein